MTGARQRVAELAASFEEQDAGLHTTDPLAFEGYTGQLEAAGPDEACLWGWADIGGVRCALVVFDFDFLGGSMGMVVGEKVARAFDAAAGVLPGGAPVVTVTASGGARMQEGMWSLVQMAKCAEARRRHRASGGVHVAVLTSPTTGGVYASFASLADVIWAEAGATTGFAGPRVVEQMTGVRPPPEVHKAEHAAEHGLVDEVVARDEVADRLARLLRTLNTEGGDGPGDTETAPAPDTRPAWDRLQAVRDPARPKGPDVLDAVLTGSTELRGDRSGRPDDPSVRVRIGLLDGMPVVALAQDASGDGRIRPAGYGKAMRAIELAGRLGKPLLTVIDTRGADPLPESEAGGVASAIARTFEALLTCPAPTLSLLWGEGGSGGALAMAVCDRVVAVPDAVFSVIAPEGAAAILYRDASRAPELAGRLRIGVEDLQELGLVDAVIDGELTGLGPRLRGHLMDVSRVPAQGRLDSRSARYRGLARPRSPG